MKHLYIILFILPLIGFGQNPLGRLSERLIEKSLELSHGMSKEEVLKIMGAPLVSDFEYNVDEWFYCKKGSE